MTVGDKLNTIKTSLANIKTSIINKGVTPAGDITTYSAAIDSISGGGLDGLTYAALDNDFLVTLGPSYSGTEYTFPNGMTMLSYNDISASAQTEIANLQNEQQQKEDEIRNSSLSSEEIQVQLEELEQEYLAKTTLCMKRYLIKVFMSMYLTENYFGLSEIKTINTNELLEYSPSFVPCTVEYLYMPNVINFANVFQETTDLTIPYIKEIYAPKVESFPSVSFGLGNAPNVEKVYINPQMNAFNNYIHLFHGCEKLTEVEIPAPSDVSSLTYCFSDCFSLTSIGGFLSRLTAIDEPASYMSGFYMAFTGCTSLTSVSFDNVKTIVGDGLMEVFRGCTSMNSISFPSLKSSAFGSDTNQFNNMLEGVTGCTVHFPSNLESVIGSWTDVTNGFGGTNTTVLFDLPETT